MPGLRISAAKVLCGLVLAACCCLAGVTANATVIEDFDGAGNTPWTLTNTSGGAPAILGGGSTGNYVRLANLNGSNNNSIAFDENLSASGPAPGGIRMLFDFRMTDDAANAAAGGCCGSAADGMGIGLFSTATYASTGGVNPGTAGIATWERPTFADAFAIGLDIFQNLDVISLNWGGSQVAEANVQSLMDLNNNTWHRAIVTLKPAGANALVDMLILEDVYGDTQIRNIFSDQSVLGLDLGSFPSYRLIAGGRTGGAYHDGDMDNFFVTSPLPEPGALALLALGALCVFVARQRAE